MDDVARGLYELEYKVAFLEKKGNAFQDFFSTIMEKRYPGDFIRVRPWGNVGDQKNDGYLKSERTLFQVYAPNELTAKQAIKKIDQDFNGALPYWKQHFHSWVFVHNSAQGLGPEVTTKLLELDTAHKSIAVSCWGFEELRRKLFELAPAELASLFGPAPTRRDLLELGLGVLAPVLDHVAAMPAPPEPDLRPPPADKISRNMLSNHVATLLKAGMTRADLVRKYFRVQPGKQDEIAESFNRRYREVRSDGVSPDEVFVQLQRHAGGRALLSPGHQSAVLAILAFFFEECDIFEREDQAGAST